MRVHILFFNNLESAVETDATRKRTNDRKDSLVSHVDPHGVRLDFFDSFKLKKYVCFESYSTVRSPTIKQNVRKY
jgi:hypothetical protein